MHKTHSHSLQARKEAVKMDIEGGISKLLNPVEKHAGLIGAGLAAFQKYQDGTIPYIADSLVRGRVHFPDLHEAQMFIQQEPNLIPAALVAMAGWALKDATSNSTLKKLAGAAQNGGTAYAAVVLGMALLSSMTQSDSGTGNGGSDLSGSRG